MSQLAYDVTSNVTPEQICSLFVSAFEGGYSPWIHEADFISGTVDTSDPVVFWGHDEYYANPFQMKIRYDSPDGEEGNAEGVKIIANADVVRGLGIMAKKYPFHFASILNENADAITGDVLVQCVLMDDIVYG